MDFTAFLRNEIMQQDDELSTGKSGQKLARFAKSFEVSATRFYLNAAEFGKKSCQPIATEISLNI